VKPSILKCTAKIKLKEKQTYWWDYDVLLSVRGIAGFIM